MVNSDAEYYQKLLFGTFNMACRDGDPNGIYSYSRPDWFRGTPVRELGRKLSIEEMNDELRQPFLYDKWIEDSRNGTSFDPYGEILKLRNAIRNHRDQHGDDRCWMDDEELYKVLPEGYTAPARDSSVEIEKCMEYIRCRSNPATKYVSPQRRIEELEAELQKAQAKIQEHCSTISQMLYKDVYGERS